MDEQDRQKIVALTVRLVAGMVERGDVDPDDDAALRAATKKCAETARSAYFAALEFLSG